MKRKAHSSSRSVGYSMDFDFNEVNTSEIETILEKSDAVLQFDVGRGSLWFNGIPGADLRQVKKVVTSMLGEHLNKTW